MLAGPISTWLQTNTWANGHAWSAQQLVTQQVGAAFAAAQSNYYQGTAALAAAGYLSRAIRGYRREARIGRVPFAVDELLARAGIEDRPDARARRETDSSCV